MYKNISRNPIKLRTGFITQPGVEFEAEEKDIPQYFRDLFTLVATAPVVVVASEPVQPRRTRTTKPTPTVEKQPSNQPENKAETEEEQIANAIQEECLEGEQGVTVEDTPAEPTYEVHHMGSGWYEIREIASKVVLAGLPKMRLPVAEAKCVELNS